MQKLESNLAAMQQCTDNRMRKFDAQQRVTEAQIHGTVASAHDMKLQLQAEVALNIARAQKQQEDARALAALVEQKLQTEEAKWCGNEKVAAHCKGNQTTAAGRNRAQLQTRPLTLRRFLHAQQSSNGDSDGRQTNFEAMRSA